ncbi:MAG: hypothetical protein EXR62_18050 [Chloroflexi bacterium]|nr:hypothetical protein [Chloroflexota bacterium]
MTSPKQLPEIDQPTILVGRIAHLPKIIAAHSQSGLSFDAITGRNALAQETDRADVIRDLARLLRPTGYISLVETLSRASPRLYALLEPGSLPQALADRLAAAEEAIYQSTTDPRFNWDASHLQQWFTQTGFTALNIKQEQISGEQLITAAMISRWFREDSDIQRPSYVQWLHRVLSETEVEQVHQAFIKQLSQKTIPWPTQVIWINASLLPG